MRARALGNQNFFFCPDTSKMAKPSFLLGVPTECEVSGGRSPSLLLKEVVFSRDEQREPKGGMKLQTERLGESQNRAGSQEPPRDLTACPLSALLKETATTGLECLV